MNTFRDLLLRHRGRTGLTQRQLAERVGVNLRSIQDWEAGANCPGAQRLQALIAAMLASNGLTNGRELDEASELWAAALREGTRMHTPFDRGWFERLLADRASNAAPVVSPQAGGPTPDTPPDLRPVMERRQDWGDAPDVRGFVGRARELASLRDWVLGDACRVVAVLGMGGIGKTSLTARVAQDLAPSFERVYWRGLRDAPSVRELLAGAIGLLSDQQLVPPEAEPSRLDLFLQLLRERHALLVLDNFETVLEPGQREGRYRDGFAGYGALLRAIGETRHQSCLLLTSRETPLELTVLEGGAVRTCTLGGLGIREAQVLLTAKQLVGDDEQWPELIARYGGNGLALKVVGESISQIFGGDIGLFLSEAGGSSAFGGIRRLLSDQVGRSAPLEQRVLRVLAVEREPVRLAQLHAALGPRVNRGEMLEALEGLRRRSLVERAESVGPASFTLQSVVLEYVTDRLVDDVADEIRSAQPERIVELPLILAQATDYVRQSQERLIGGAILQRLTAHQGASVAEQQLGALLEHWRNRSTLVQGYGPGNVVNLLRLLRGDLRGLDLSHLELRQAYLAGVEAQGASLADAHLADTVLAEAFAFPGSIALSGDGALLAAGTSTGPVWLWRVTDRTLVAMLEGHSGAVWGGALASDDRLMASGSGDGTVRLWDVTGGRPRATLTGHTGTVWSVALATEVGLLASGGGDHTVRLWELASGRELLTLVGHTGAVRSVALSADGQLLASGSFDGTVRLWQPSTGQLLAVLRGHTSAVWGVALSADHQLVASGGQDGTVRLWEATSGRPRASLEGHAGGVWSVALSADGRLLASGGGDGTLRLWEAVRGRPLATMRGHTGSVWGAKLTDDGRLLASGGGDGMVRLWEAPSGRPLATLQGHTSGVRGVALSADGRLAASGGQDGRVRLWQPASGRLLAVLGGHAGGLWGVALSADGQLIASAGGDGTVRSWETSTLRALARLEGHTGGVWSLALSADGELVASGGEDGTIRLWQPRSGRRLATLQGHASAVAGVALSADGELLASGGGDGTVRLWEASTGRLLVTVEGHTSAVWGLALDTRSGLLASGSEDGTVRLWALPDCRRLATLRGHAGVVYGVAFGPSGALLVSGGADGLVRLWNVGSGRSVATLQGHTGVVRGVAVSADGRLVASAGFDETVRIWDARDGAALHVLRSPGRYEGVDITHLTGITEAQRTALLALGAVERTELARASSCA
jgi:WD40 repeat protein/transcriptional regulator with XRE-family HTH domain